MTQISLILSVVKIEQIIVAVLFFITLYVQVMNFKINKKKRASEPDDGLIIKQILFFSSFILWIAFFGIAWNLLSPETIPTPIISIFTALYSTSIFTTLVTSFINLKKEKQIDETIQRYDDKLEKTINTIDIIYNQDKYSPCQIFQSNSLNEPSKEFHEQLIKYLLKSDFYIYEGENAQNASMCLKYIQDHYKKDIKRPIAIRMILREFDVLPSKENKNEVIDLFATLYFLTEILDKECFELKVYKRNSITATFVNLTSERLFFSPFGTNQKYPVTYCYSKSSTPGKESLYDIFITYMRNRIDNFQQSNSDLYSFFKLSEFVNTGYFGENTSAKGKTFLPASVKKELKKRLDKRIELYKDCLK